MESYGRQPSSVEDGTLNEMGVTKLITVKSAMMNVRRDALRWSADVDVKSRDEKAMIRPTVICSRHGSCDMHVSSVSCSCKDIVEYVPLFGAGVFPSRFLLIRKLKESICYNEVVFSTKTQ